MGEQCFALWSGVDSTPVFQSASTGTSPVSWCPSVLKCWGFRCCWLAACLARPVSETGWEERAVPGCYPSWWFCQDNELIIQTFPLQGGFCQLLFIKYSLKTAFLIFFFFSSFTWGKSPEPSIWMSRGEVIHHLQKTCLALMFTTCYSTYLSKRKWIPILLCHWRLSMNLNFYRQVIILYVYVFSICESILQIFTSVIYTSTVARQQIHFYPGNHLGFVSILALCDAQQIFDILSFKLVSCCSCASLLFLRQHQEMKNKIKPSARMPPGKRWA